jgi:hypothetical protein
VSILCKTGKRKELSRKHKMQKHSGQFVMARGIGQRPIFIYNFPIDRKRLAGRERGRTASPI